MDRAYHVEVWLPSSETDVEWRPGIIGLSRSGGSRSPTAVQRELASLVCVALLSDPLLDLVHGFGD
ncbi:hypothetical protein GCM10010339_70860 [Streptomyces alanosinicus]|uniref:Uncharacterized protein n=1 Tax=Streptomyces alanosinicus TaxID=68171 RepID=A0A918YP99_9ACTN|nr:hypothetical protein GCM10010339_70860 [Streptomyces alanosinicus]